MSPLFLAAAVALFILGHPIAGAWCLFGALCTA